MLKLTDILSARQRGSRGKVQQYACLIIYTSVYRHMCYQWCSLLMLELYCTSYTGTVGDRWLCGDWVDFRLSLCPLYLLTAKIQDYVFTIFFTAISGKQLTIDGSSHMSTLARGKPRNTFFILSWHQHGYANSAGVQRNMHVK